MTARRETGVAEAFAQRAVELRRHFVENFDVQRHFADPARAWDEAFKANDGGVSYLVNSLIPVCDPAIKRAQVRGQLEVQLRRLVDRLAGFHSAADGDSRAKKRDLVHTVLRGLATCIQQQLFGELVAALQVADFGAARHLLAHRHRARGRRAGAQERQAAGAGHAVERRDRRSRRDLRRRVRRGGRPHRAAVRRARGPRRALRPRGGRILAGEHAPRRRRREGAVAFRRRPPASRLADRRAGGGRPSPEADRPALARRARAGERRQRQVGGDRRAPGAHRRLGAERLRQRARASTGCRSSSGPACRRTRRRGACSRARRRPTARRR